MLRPEKQAESFETHTHTHNQFKSCYPHLLVFISSCERYTEAVGNCWILSVPYLWHAVLCVSIVKAGG